jgi:hypothetical protein
MMLDETKAKLAGSQDEAKPLSAEITDTLPEAEVERRASPSGSASAARAP